MTDVCLRRLAAFVMSLLVSLVCGSGAITIENTSSKVETNVPSGTDSQVSKPESCLEAILKKSPPLTTVEAGISISLARLEQAEERAAPKHLIDPSVKLNSRVKAQVMNGKLQIMPGKKQPRIAKKKPATTNSRIAARDAEILLDPAVTRAALESMLSEWDEKAIGVDDTLVQHVTYFLKCFALCEREGTAATLERSRKYLPQIKQVFAKHRIPEDLAFAVPFVESRFSETAISNAGAAGMFQFLAPTAKDYGLNIPCDPAGDGPAGVDERFEWSKTCPAAAQYLSNHRKMFNSILLALGAYHHGADTVTKVLASIAKEGKSKTFHSIFTCSQLAPHSREYIPLCLAAAYLHRLIKQSNTGRIPNVRIQYVNIKKPTPLATLSTQHQDLTVNNPDLALAEELYCYASTGGYLLITELNRTGTKTADSQIQPVRNARAKTWRNL